MTQPAFIFLQWTLATELHAQEIEGFDIVCRDRLCGHKIFIEKPFTSPLCASGMPKYPSPS